MFVADPHHRFYATSVNDLSSCTRTPTSISEKIKRVSIWWISMEAIVQGYCLLFTYLLFAGSKLIHDHEANGMWIFNVFKLSIASAIFKIPWEIKLAHFLATFWNFRSFFPLSCSMLVKPNSSVNSWHIKKKSTKKILSMVRISAWQKQKHPSMLKHVYLIAKQLKTCPIHQDVYNLGKDQRGASLNCHFHTAKGRIINISAAKGDEPDFLGTFQVELESRWQKKTIINFKHTNWWCEVLLVPVVWSYNIKVTYYVSIFFSMSSSNICLFQEATSPGRAAAAWELIALLDEKNRQKIPQVSTEQRDNEMYSYFT